MYTLFLEFYRTIGNKYFVHKYNVCVKNKIHETCSDFKNNTDSELEYLFLRLYGELFHLFYQTNQ